MPETLRAQLVETLKQKGLARRDEQFVLASGQLTNWFLDGKQALAHWDDLELACRAIAEAVHAQGIEFDAVGGLSLGADALSVGVAAVARCRWFFVRKEPKNRGTNRLIEGYQVGEGDRVLVVDDVVTSGGSIITAHDRIVERGAQVVAAVTLADRSNVAAAKFAALGVPYIPMATYADLGIPCVEFDEVS